MPHTLLHSLGWLLALLLLSSCTDTAADLPPVTPGEETPADGDELYYHDRTRQEPYPKMNNQIYLNPVPLMVPSEMKGKALLQFALSRSEAFDDDCTQLSEPVAWCMFNPHRTLEEGVWYWRFRTVSATDGTVGEWSETYRFEMTDDVPRFLTPDAESFLRALPTGHPRMHIYLNNQAEAARRTLTTHPEYKSLISRAKKVVATDFSDIASYYQGKAVAESLNSAVWQLYQACYLTQESLYIDKLMEIASLMVARTPNEKELFSSDSNFTPTHLTEAYIFCYDFLFDRLTSSQRHVVEELLLQVVRFYYNVHVGKRENDIFDSHFWQFNLMGLFQCAYMLYDKATYREEVLPMLSYFYEIWTARAPGTGFNRDGVWHNSASYFNTNVETLSYMPSIFSYITGCDFLAHPWYQAAGRALIYTWPVGSGSCGFGDGSSGGDTPSRQRIAFADFLARRTGDAYACWYAGKGIDLLLSDFLLRLDRIVGGSLYATEAPQQVEKMVWYKDTGEAVMHSALGDNDHNLSLAFRSSRFGCTEHTFANENAFNLLYKGVDVYRNTGYYLKYGSPHHITDCRHTRAHNTLLVNGVGQGFTTKAYGDILRGLCGQQITYCLGDASHAYNDTCTVTSWLQNMAAAGVKQTAEYGFGPTPLTHFLRHVWMLHPDVVVIYDELEAGEPVSWEWLLHSPTAFTIDAAGQGSGVAHLTTANQTKQFTAQGILYSAQPMALSQTDRFINPPTDVPDPAYPNQWHLKARVENSRANRFLYIVQVVDNGNEPQTMGGEENRYTIGPWTIEAEMNPDRKPLVRITHATEPLLFDYSAASTVGLPDGTTYTRKYAASSILYEGGQVQEQTDYLPAHTRSLGGGN